MVNDLGYIISEICFDLGEGYPERDKDNFDGEWINLSYFDFSYRLSNIKLEIHGDLECPYYNKAFVENRLVFHEKFHYVCYDEDSESITSEVLLYQPGEWEEIIRRKYWNINERKQMDFSFMRIGETMDFEDEYSEFYF